MTDVAGGVTSFTYDVDSRPVGMVRPNAVVTDTVFDAAGRVTGITHTGPGGVIDNYSYGYDGVGNRTSFTSNAGAETYELDALYRLTGFTAADGTVTSFTYDGADART